MTLRHLLTHTSGIGEAPTVEGLAAVASPDRTLGESSRAISAASIRRASSSRRRPAQSGPTQTTAIALLGEIIVRAEKAPLAGVMERRIFGPLGMRDTDMRDLPERRG